MPYRPHTFIGEQIIPRYAQEQVLLKRPRCPDGFSWRNKEYSIEESIEEWVDFTRRGRQARNMSPRHTLAAEQHGSWGVGRFHFHVRTTGGDLYHIYYDRAPKDVDIRSGAWFIVSDLVLEAF